MDRSHERCATTFDLRQVDMRLWGRCPGSGRAAARGEADISGASCDDVPHATVPQNSAQRGLGVLASRETLAK